MNKIITWFESEKASYLSLLISFIALFFSFFRLIPAPFDLAWIAILLCSVPIIKGAIIGLVKEFDIKADVLVSIALIASIVIGEIFAAGEVAFIMTLGALLEERTVLKARAGIEKLIHLTPRTGRILKDGKECIVSAEEIKPGDILRVFPGETIAVDGVVRNGATSINQAVMTGESMPVDKMAGDEVYSGTVNQFGTFDMEATKIDEESSLQRMIQLVESADASKSKIVGIADKMATWIVAIALVSSVLTWLISGEIIRAVTILVVFCPCALVLATPTAIMAAIGNASKYGILIREGDALERLSKVREITFDKTGTLTQGKPVVTYVHSFKEQIPEGEILKIAASVEQFSEHPLGKAIVKHYKMLEKSVLYKITDFFMLIGKGVYGKFQNETVFAGNIELIQHLGVEVSKEIETETKKFYESGGTIVFVGVDKDIKGFLVLEDILREDAVCVVNDIQKQGINVNLLTGDHEAAAKSIASKLGIVNVYAKCLPENKMKLIEQYQNAGKYVCMIGDGINDAPALKKAYVGIAMGGVGSDIAVDAADIVLVNDDVKYLPHLFHLSIKTMGTIRMNIALSMALNFIAILLAMSGVLNPIVGALVHNVGSVVVIIHSAFLLKVKPNWGIK